MEQEALYILRGEVVRGRGMGRLIGMPTANLKLPERTELPPVGVYITRVILGDENFYGITNVGTRPTVDNDSKVTVETHILNFNRDIYGEILEIQLYKNLRFPQKFKDLSSLMEQIINDSLMTWKFWGIERKSSPLEMNFKEHRASLNGKELELSSKEFDVLYLLYSNPDAAFTKKEIYEAVWHEPAVGGGHAVENTVFQIRKKLNSAGDAQKLIKTVVGYGYKFNA